MMNVVNAEGEPQELAYFVCLVLSVMKDKAEKDKEKAVKDWLDKYGDKTFDELMRMEREEEE